MFGPVLNMFIGVTGELHEWIMLGHKLHKNRFCNKKVSHLITLKFLQKIVLQFYLNATKSEPIFAASVGMELLHPTCMCQEDFSASTVGFYLQLVAIAMLVLTINI